MPDPPGPSVAAPGFDEPMAIRLGDLLSWLVPGYLVVGGIGAYPTWALKGLPGLVSLVAAALCSFAAATFTGWLIGRASQEGPVRAAAAFLPCEAYRLGIVLVAGAVIWALGGEVVSTVLWLLGLHLLALLCETQWLVRALRKDERLAEQGRVHRLFLRGGREIDWDI